MKKIFFLLACLSSLTGLTQNFHFSLRAGIASYRGDLKAKNAFPFSQSNLLGSIGARYDLTEHLSARTYITFTGLHADDKKGTAAMRMRNLNFRTKIIDWEGTVQYNFLNLNNSWWTPYAFAGIGVFHFNPYTKDTSGHKVFLRPLSTEGEGFIAGVKEYKRTQFSIPFGVGAERSLNEDMRIGIEMGYRKTFTDYIDDVSTNYVDKNALLAARGPKAVELAYRGGEVGAGPYPPAGATRGSPKSKDGYFYIAVTYTARYFFDKYKQTAGLPAFKKQKRVGCPASRY